MQQCMVEILYIIEKEDRGSKGIQDRKRNLANSARRCRTLVMRMAGQGANSPNQLGMGSQSGEAFTVAPVRRAC